MGIFNKKPISLTDLQKSTNTIPEKPVVEEEKKVTKEKPKTKVVTEQKEKKTKKEEKKDIPEEIENSIDDLEDIDDEDIDDLSIDDMLEEQPEPENKKKKNKKPAKKPKSRAEEIQDKLASKDLIVLKVMGNELLRFEGEECKTVKIDDLENRILNDFGMKEFSDGFTWNMVDDKEDANTCYLIPVYKFQNKG